jgi:hypothetical protein
MLLKNKKWEPIKISIDANTILMKLEEAKEIGLRVAYAPYTYSDGVGHIRRRIAGLLSELAVASYYKTYPKNIETNDPLILKACDMLFFNSPSFFEIKTSSQYSLEERGGHFLKAKNKDLPYIFCNVDLSAFEINPFKSFQGITIKEKIENEAKYFKECILMSCSEKATVQLLGIASPKILRKYTCPLSSSAGFSQRKVFFLQEGLEHLLTLPPTLKELNEMGYDMFGVNFNKIMDYIENIIPYHNKVIDIKKEIEKRNLLKEKEE